MNKVQKIGLGTVQFGLHYGISNKKGQTPIPEVKKILTIARENNIQLLDTASAYGNAEIVLGEMDITSFKVVSKFMPPVDGKSVSDQLQITLQNLRLDSLYGYLAHRPFHLVKNLNIWDQLQSLKEEGLIKKIGISLSEPSDLERLLEKNIQPDIIQVPFNYLDRRFKEQMISLKTDGCEIHSRSTFLQGLFFMDIDQLDSYFKPVIPVIKQLQASTKNLPGALLNFVLSQPFIDKVIIGIENREQLIQNLNSMNNFERLSELKKDIPDTILNPSNWSS